MSRERWGTFAVNDHLRKHAFINEALLYDRLVIPYPPQDERSYWEEQQWDPDRLDRYLEILGPSRGMRAPWGDQQRQYFGTRYRAASGASFDAGVLIEGQEQGRDPYQITRLVLTENQWLPRLPRGVAKVRVVAAYPTLGMLKREFGLNEPQQQREQLGIILGYRFLDPCADNRDDLELLREAVALSSSDEFRRQRADLNRWQEDVIAEGISNAKAIEEMEEYLEKYNRLVRQLVKKQRWRYAFMIAKALNSLPLINIANLLLDTIEGRVFGRDEGLPAGSDSAAAMIHTARRHFGWGKSP